MSDAGPGHRVGAVTGTGRVRVTIRGRLVADSRRPVLVHESGLPVRYYLPPQDVDHSAFVPTPTRTYCPFKGEAVYWAYRGAGEGVPEVPDVMWSYPDPLAPLAAIAGHLSFYGHLADVVAEEFPGAG